MKRILIAVAGTEGTKEYKDVQLLPQTKVRDVLTQLGLNDFQLSRPGGGVFGEEDNLYKAVEDDQKLFATKSDVEAGICLSSLAS